MPIRVQTLRSSTKGQRPAANSREVGELYVNLADLQFGVINATKDPQDLVAVRFWSTATDYVAGNHVIQAGNLYRAKGAIASGAAFNATQWDLIVGQAALDAALALKLDASAYTAADVLAKVKTVDGAGSGLDADTMDGNDGAFYLNRTNHTNTQLISTVSGLQTELDLKAPIASPVFTGNPTAPTPTAGDADASIATTAFVTNAVGTRTPEAPNDTNAYGRKALAWVDVAEEAPSDGIIRGRKDGAWTPVVGGAIVSDTAPGGVLLSGQFWWNSSTGNTHIYYTDLDSSQWVQQNVTGPVNVDKITSTPSDLWLGFKGSPPNGKLTLNTALDGLGTDVFTVSEGGAVVTPGTIDGGTITSTSNITAGNYCISSAGGFQGSATVAVLGTGGSGGAVYFRPNGIVNGTGQAIIDTNGSMGITGNFSASGSITAGAAVVSNNGNFVSPGAVLLGAAGSTVYLRPNTGNAAYDTTIDSGGNMNVSGYFAAAGQVITYSGIRCKAGLSGGLYGNVFSIGYPPSSPQLWIDNVNFGYIAFTSDYRIKKDVVPLVSMWEKVKGLRPVSYTLNDYGTLFKSSDIEMWGFIAHEVQEDLLPSAANGYKDEENVVQSLNVPAIVSALTKALQEAIVRIEDLTARIEVLEALP
jgi:hypothetical protein